MSGGLRASPAAHRRAPANDFPAPPVRIHVRPNVRAGRGYDNLRPARGVLTGVMLGVASWAVILLLYWLSAD